MAVMLLVMFAFPLSAQEVEDSVFTFRFFSNRDMFFSPTLNNGKELTRLFECVDRCKKKTPPSDILFYVDGYFNSKGDKADNREIAKIRSNRVKSELITRKGMKEDNFVTRNHAGRRNFVKVRVTSKSHKNLFLSEPQIAEKEERQTTLIPAENEGKDEIALPEESHDVADVISEPEPECAAEPDTVDNTRKYYTIVKYSDHLALKTNLLDYAILMPNIELEWMFVNRWSVAVEVQGAWYAKNKNSASRKIYRLASVIPEVRYWAIDRSRWHGMYVGVFGGVPFYDLDGMFGKKGHEGEGGMVGLSVGYMWPISKHLSLDAGVGVGYMHLSDKVYIPYDGHFPYQFTRNINYFGPLRLKLSLVWRFQSDRYIVIK